MEAEAEEEAKPNEELEADAETKAEANVESIAFQALLGSEIGNRRGDQQSAVKRNCMRIHSFHV